MPHCPSHIQVHDKTFQLFLHPDAIQERVEEIGKKITEEYRHKNPLILSILNGSFIFAADLLRCIACPCEISFLKYASYQAMSQTENVTTLIGINENIKGRDIIVVEDIIDTGVTMSKILADLEVHQPASVTIAALLLKPEMLRNPIEIRYLGYEIENKFVVGYGLDFDRQGRNYAGIYQLAGE